MTYHTPQTDRLHLTLLGAHNSNKMKITGTHNFLTSSRKSALPTLLQTLRHIEVL